MSSTAELTNSKLGIKAKKTKRISHYIVDTLDLENADGPFNIKYFGLTTGYGLPAAESFAAQLEKRLQDAGRAVRVTNAGISGDTTSDRLTQLDWSLKKKPRLVILELGANDDLK